MQLRVRCGPLNAATMQLPSAATPAVLRVYVAELLVLLFQSFLHMFCGSFLLCLLLGRTCTCGVSGTLNSAIDLSCSARIYVQK